jgi:hypothetical protein
MSAGDGIPLAGSRAVIIFCYRLSIIRGKRPGERERAFANVPSEIEARLAGRNKINFFLPLFANIADIEIAIVGVEARPEWVAQTINPDFRRAAARSERIVRRDSVVPVIVCGKIIAGWINAQDGAQDRVDVLAVSVRIAGAAAIP